MTHFRHILGLLALATLLQSCIEESTTPVVFDQVLESTTFENRLLTKVIIFRDGIAIDTLEARTQAVYPLNRKGAVRHSWKILAPIDNSGNPAGVEPTENLGVQYRVNATYVIDNGSLSEGTLFTPRIGNYTPYSLRITANYNTSRMFSSNYTVRPNQITSSTHAPYYYWVSDSNILLTPTIGGRSYLISRDDSTAYGTLRMDSASPYDGAGVTEPISVY